jgi:gamma-D-glutamyl-L-lysine dipeptidyl-peptidase
VRFSFPFFQNGDEASAARRRLARRHRRADRADRRRRPGLLRTQSGPVRGQDSWKYVDRKVYIDDAMRRRTPVWVVPAVVTLLLALLVFFVAPYAASGLQSLFGNGDVDPGQTAVRVLADGTLVVKVEAADILDRPDLRGTRLTQALYNTPVVSDPARSVPGYTAVKLPDGTEGFITSDQLTSARDSAEPDLYKYKLVVSDRVRRIMSHASQGTLLQEVMMGTVLYSDFRGDGIYRVALAGGGTGWIGGNGLIELGVDEKVRMSGAEAFVSSAMAFLDMTYLPGGLTQNGIDSIGLIQVSAAVNGKDLPRRLDALAAEGTEVALARDEVSGLWETDDWQDGDLVLFASATGDESGATYGDVALYIGEGQVLMARPSRSSVRLVTLADDPALSARIALVRRIFPTP